MGVIMGLILFSFPVVSEACWGRAAFIVDNPSALADKVLQTRDGKPFYLDKEGNLLVDKKSVKIPSGLAYAIAKRFMERTYPTYEHLEFEALTFEHGSLVYMFEAHVPGSAISYHVGPMKFVTDHYHLHVDAMTGEVYGIGCGGGPGSVEMTYNPDEYPPGVKNSEIKLKQFDTDFVIREGEAPMIDGRIDPEEWKDAVHREVHIGTLKDEILSYG